MSWSYNNRRPESNLFHLSTSHWQWDVWGLSIHHAVPHKQHWRFHHKDTCTQGHEHSLWAQSHQWQDRQSHQRLNELTQFMTDICTNHSAINMSRQCIHHCSSWTRKESKRNSHQDRQWKIKHKEHLNRRTSAENQECNWQKAHRESTCSLTPSQRWPHITNCRHINQRSTISQHRLNESHRHQHENTLQNISDNSTQSDEGSHRHNRWSSSEESHRATEQHATCRTVSTVHCMIKESTLNRKEIQIDDSEDSKCRESQCTHWKRLDWRTRHQNMWAFWERMPDDTVLQLSAIWTHRQSVQNVY